MYKLYDIYLESTRPTKLCTILLMIISSIGVMLDANSSLGLLTNIAPSWFWSIMFLLMATLRGCDLFAERACTLAEFLTPVIIVWIWTLILTASIIQTPIDAMGFLYTVPIGIELWFISRLVDDKLNNSLTVREH